MAIKYQSFEFERAIGLKKDLDRFMDNLPEVVISGKSNVGKSTLINMLGGSKKLAKVSSTPGKTATVNFFKVNDGKKSFRLVDLPGYGFAAGPKAKRERFSEITESYLTSGRAIKGVFCLLDVRRDITELDRLMLSFAANFTQSFVVLTKCDKLNKTEDRQRTEYFEEALAEYDIKFIKNDVKGNGISEIKNTIKKIII